MMSKCKFILVLLILVISISTITFANHIYKPPEVDERIDTTQEELNGIKSTGGKIVGIIKVVGTIVAFGMIAILGMKFMLGSAEQKAEYKKTLLPYIIGAVMIFGVSNITQVIFDWANEWSTESKVSKKIVEIVKSINSSNGISLLTDEQVLEYYFAFVEEQPSEYGLYWTALYEEGLRRGLIDY